MKNFVSMLIVVMMVAISMIGIHGSVTAEELSGEFVIANWFGGPEYDMVIEMEKNFEQLHPGVTAKDINVTGAADPRPLLKSMLVGGQIPDLMLSAWPSLDQELQKAGFLTPLDDVWQQYGWDKALNPSWKELGSIGGKVYGVYFLADNRSGLWYRVDMLNQLGVKPPTTWDEFKAVAQAYKKAGITPISIGADSWAHNEFFENLMLRIGGPEAFMKLVRHEIPWTDPVVVNVLKRWKELLDEGLFADGATMLGTGWDLAFKQVMEKSAGMNLIGSWVNGMAQKDHGLKPGQDYDFFQFPIIDPNVPANYMQISAKDWVLCKGGKNPKAAVVFLDFVLTVDAGKIVAKHGGISPNKLVPTDIYDPIAKKVAELYAKNGVVFVLDDLLPTELSSEFRTQTQRFLNTPTEEQIKKTLEAIEAKAKEMY
jgi:ABC-type glycerol-3-phosphate transport system substrate-binding protein